MRSCCQGGCGIEALAGERHHLPAAQGIVVLAPGRSAGLCNGVGAVERIIEAAPAGIGGVEGIAGIGRRNDELRSSNACDLGINMGCLDLERLTFRDEIADLLEKILVSLGLERVFAMPGVDFFLELVAAGEQLAIARRKIVDDVACGLPETFRIDTGAGKRLAGDKMLEFASDLQPCNLRVPAQGGILLSIPLGKPYAPLAV